MYYSKFENVYSNKEKKRVAKYIDKINTEDARYQLNQITTNFQDNFGIITDSDISTLNDYYQLQSYDNPEHLLKDKNKYSQLENIDYVLNKEEFKEGYRDMFNSTTGYSQLGGQNIALPDVNKNLNWDKYLNKNNIESIPRKQAVQSFARPQDKTNDRYN